MLSCSSWEHGFAPGDLSYTGTVQKQNCCPGRKRRVRWEARRSCVILIGCLTFLFESPVSGMCPLSVGETQWLHLDGESVLMRFDKCLLYLFFLFHENVCMSVCVYWQHIKSTKLPVMFEFAVLLIGVKLKHHILGSNHVHTRLKPTHLSLFPPLVSFSFGQPISRDRGGWGLGSGPIGKLVPPPGSAGV